MNVKTAMARMKKQTKLIDETETEHKMNSHRPNNNVAKVERGLQHFIDHFEPGRDLLWKVLVVVILYSALVCFVDNHNLQGAKLNDANAVISVSAIVGILLIFRNNSAYDRWWEGRKLWGQLVNESRNLAIKTYSYAKNLPDTERQRFGLLISQFAYTLKDHLRQKRDGQILELLSVTDKKQHIPLAVTQQIYDHLKQWRSAGYIDEWEQLQINEHAKTLMDICGACERILKSPIVGSYKLLLWFGLTLNVLCLPWFLVPSFHWMTVAIMAVSSYLIFGLELLAEEVERPFDDMPNDLPLESICETIRTSVEEIFELELRNESAEKSLLN